MARHTQQRLALVTGAARGLGQIFAQRLAQDGCDVMLVDLLPCDQTAELVTKAGRRAHSVTCDLSDGAQIEALVRDAGPIDILVNNAVFQPFIAWDQLDAATLRKILAINTEASFLLSQGFAHGMKARNWGRIVNLASSSAWAPPPGFVGYIISKMGNIGLTRAMARELGDDGITVNAIAPGLTRTGAAARDVPQAAFDAVRSQQLIHRTGMPEDLAGMLSFLCSDDAAFITGQTMHVDGGTVL